MFSELALAYVHDNKVTSPKKFSLKDIIGDGMLLAVPKFRRTIEKRLKRKYGSPEYVWKMIVPKNNIKVCQTCGHHHEKGLLCGRFHNVKFRYACQLLRLICYSVVMYEKVTNICTLVSSSLTPHFYY